MVLSVHGAGPADAVRDDHCMTRAALLISILALVVAVLSARYTRQQARAAGATAEIDKARRHDELVPRFAAELEPMPNSSLYCRLRLRLDSRQSLTALTVRLLEAPVDVQFTHGQTGTDPRARAPVHEAFAIARSGVALRADEQAIWQIELNSVPNRGLRLQVDAQIGDEVWQVPVTVPIPIEYASRS